MLEPDVPDFSRWDILHNQTLRLRRENPILSPSPSSLRFEPSLSLHDPPESHSVGQAGRANRLPRDTYSRQVAFGLGEKVWQSFQC